MGSQSLRDPAAAVLIALRRIVRHLRLADRRAERSVGLSAAQTFVLRSLVGAPTESLAELAARTMTDQSSVSTVVAKLVARGLVIRKVSHADRRRAELRLTAAGERAIRTAPRSPQPQIAAAVRALTPARRAELVRALDTLVAALGAGQTPARMLFEDDGRERRGRSRDRE